ncbi:MAG: ParA family protein [Pseudolabrys sp.]|nr:ParA family protein [Pseudolabrys sp.]
MIVTFASSKGGVGKSTTCAAVAAHLALGGEGVQVIDLDQNGTLKRWALRTSIPNLTVTAIEPPAFTAFCRESQESGEFDHILIDLAGSREVTLLKALARADLVIIPAQASEPDMREALVIADDLRDVAETAGREIPFRVLLTKMFPLRTRVSEFAFAELERHRLPRFETVLIERASYREMFLNGEPPTLTEPNRAGAEIAALVAEMKAVVGAASVTRSAA